VIIVVEGFPPLKKEKLSEILTEISKLIEQYCHAQTRMEILSMDVPRMNI
jgi:DNA/RNA-binding domain of Phe-tRNA-synthetase-like protein